MQQFYTFETACRGTRSTTIKRSSGPTAGCALAWHFWAGCLQSMSGSRFLILFKAISPHTYPVPSYLRNLSLNLEIQGRFSQRGTTQRCTFFAMRRSARGIYATAHSASAPKKNSIQNESSRCLQIQHVHSCDSRSFLAWTTLHLFFEETSF